MGRAIEGVKRLLRNKKEWFYALERRGFYDKLSDDKFIRKKWKVVFDTEIDLDNPKTFNEKLQWLKLNNRKSIYTTMVDKYSVKKFVSDVIGEEYVIPSLGVWDSYDEIDFDSLPDRFVLKCTHDSGSVKVIRDKKSIDHQHIKSFFEKKLSYNYFYLQREWPYKNVKPRIIAEQYIEDDILRMHMVRARNGFA